MKDDRLYFDHIVQAIERIQSYIAGVSFESFQESNLLLDAVVFDLCVIGEACNKISEGFRKKHPSIPWKDIRGMRNRIIHQYFEINEKVVWTVCTQDLPDLKDFFMTFLRD